MSQFVNATSGCREITSHRHTDHFGGEDGVNILLVNRERPSR